jgi:osmotically-inducible protein OsmY
MKQLPFIILTTTVLAMPALTGCVPAVFAAGGAVAGAGIAGDNRTLQTINQDENASYQANSRLSASKELLGKVRANAIVFNHEMLLDGQALTESAKMQAEDLVKSVPTATKIYKQIAIKEP